ncbi:ABC transporter permease [Patescibacteria group bacterium]|nr:ABC transporter permease [Patescibacteria group bacterium]MBU1922192.1 ABC transporter permease [Patescibacteria group bacterium]
MILRISAKIVMNVVRQSKMRAFLTMLGIIIGIAAVILVVSVGAGAQSLILNQIKSMGTDLISIMPGGSEEEGPPAAVMGITITTLTYDDAKALVDSARAPHVAAVAPIVQGVATFTWGSNKYDGNFMGTSHAFLDVEDYEVAQGNWFMDSDEKSLAQVAILGSEVKKQLFGDSNAIGEKIKFQKKSFRIIGVMEERGVSGFTNYDTYVYVPVTTAQKLLLGINHISMARAKVDNEAYIDQSIEDISYILRDRHGIVDPKQDDFTVRSAKQGLEVIGGVTDSLRFFLAAIAGIALLVGGIGIMNTMLVAVKERIHEIGIRKAMGAKNRDILMQFLLESIFFTLLGGVVGIIIGAVFSTLVAVVVRYLGYDWDLLISLNSVLIACGVSVVIGLIFGVYPAQKASKLEPMTALRYE